MCKTLWRERALYAESTAVHYAEALEVLVSHLAGNECVNIRKPDWCNNANKNDCAICWRELALEIAQDA